MKRTTILFLILLYTPIFAGIFMPHNIKFHLLIYLTMGLLIFSKKLHTSRYFLKKVKPIFQFLIFFTILFSLQLFYKMSGLYYFIDVLTVYFLSITIILFLSNYRKNSLIKFLENVFYLVGVMFLIQFVLSAYESINYFYLDEAHNWALPYVEKDYTTLPTDYVSIRKRWLPQIIGIDFGLLDYFRLPFSGLLGQANFWAVQLPFYNLIFLLMYHKTKRKYFLFLVFLVLAAILLNTTRSAIFTILLTDIIYMLFIGKSKKYNYMTISGAVILLFIYTADIVRNFLIYFKGSNTLTGRIETYISLLQYSRLSEIPLVWGYNVQQLLDIERYHLLGRGFESYFFDVLFYNGIFGLFLFIYLLLKIMTQGRKFSTVNKYFSILIVINIIGISLTINGPVSDYAFSFVTILYIYNVVSDPSYNESPLNNLYNKKSLIR